MPVVGLLATRACAIAAAASIARRGALVRAARALVIHHREARAGCDAIKNGHTRYSPNTGTAALRKAVCAKLEEENGLEYSPSEIVLSNG